MRIDFSGNIFWHFEKILVRSHEKNHKFWNHRNMKHKYHFETKTPNSFLCGAQNAISVSLLMKIGHNCPRRECDFLRRQNPEFSVSAAGVFFVSVAPFVIPVFSKTAGNMIESIRCDPKSPYSVSSVISHLFWILRGSIELGVEYSEFAGFFEISTKNLFVWFWQRISIFSWSHLKNAPKNVCDLLLRFHQSLVSGNIWLFSVKRSFHPATLRVWFCSEAILWPKFRKEKCPFETKSFKYFRYDFFIRRYFSKGKVVLDPKLSPAAGRIQNPLFNRSQTIQTSARCWPEKISFHVKLGSNHLTEIEFLYFRRCRSRLELFDDLRCFLGIFLGSFNRFEAFLSDFWEFHGRV